MSGSLKRAVALWVASKVTDLNVYADDLVNTKHKYPSCSVIELNHVTRPVGCGKKDFVVRDEDDDDEDGIYPVSASGKMHVADDVFRITVSAPSNKQFNGQEIVDNILNTLESAILNTCFLASPMIMTDTGTTPATQFRIEKMKSNGRQSVPPDVTGEPFLFRGSLSLWVTSLVPIQETVEFTIDEINLSF